MAKDVASAIASLRPGKGFVIHGDDLSSIQWMDDGVDPVTQAEVDAEATRLEAAAAQAAADALAAREAAIAKLAALGLTVDDLTALGL